MRTTEDGSSGASRRVQQAPGLWRTDLQQHDLSVPGRAVIQARVDLGPTAPLVKHTHPGEEIIYILEGSLEYQVDGQPTRTYNAGDALTVPAGVIHAGAQPRQRQRGRTRHLCRRERQAAHHGGRLSGRRQPGKAMTAQVKRALEAARITLALQANAAVPAAAATSGSKTVHGMIVTCPTGHADRRGSLASTATKQRRSS